DSNTVQAERLDSEELASESAIIGTLGYMAPEQLRGEPALPATDIFALGCILYEAVAGANPFMAGSTVDTISAVMRDDVSALPRNVPQEYERVVRRCLEKHAEGRFQSARDLSFALWAVGTSPVWSAPATPALSERRHGRRTPQIVAAIVIVIVAAAILALRARERGGGPLTLRSIDTLH